MIYQDNNGKSVIFVRSSARFGPTEHYHVFEVEKATKLRIETNRWSFNRKKLKAIGFNERWSDPAPTIITKEAYLKGYLELKNDRYKTMQKEIEEHKSSIATLEQRMAAILEDGKKTSRGIAACVLLDQTGE